MQLLFVPASTLQPRRPSQLGGKSVDSLYFLNRWDDNRCQRCRGDALCDPAGTPREEARGLTGSDEGNGPAVAGREHVQSGSGAALECQSETGPDAVTQIPPPP